MTCARLLPVLALLTLVAACAPAPLYTSSGLQRGAATWGEIPRDARGEPVWAAIRPAPPSDFNQAPATARSTQPEAASEGDAEASPKPPTT
jgi:hypothetical protein